LLVDAVVRRCGGGSGNRSSLGRTFGFDDSFGTINLNVGDTLHEASLFVFKADDST
jgi:hypothetical protein